MQRHAWFESLARELTRAQLPAAYRAQLLAELADHAEDLRLAADGDPLAQASLMRRLGSPESVARTALLQYRQRRFGGRHPVAMFVLLPIPLALAVVFVLALGLAVAGERVLPTPSLMQGVRLTMVTVPFLVSALICCWMARRAAAAFRWQIVSCVMLAATAACFFSRLRFGPNTFSIALAPPVTLLQIMQALLPLAVLGWSYRRLARRAAQPPIAAR